MQVPAFSPYQAYNCLQKTDEFENSLKDYDETASTLNSVYLAKIIEVRNTLSVIKDFCYEKFAQINLNNAELFCNLAKNLLAEPTINKAAHLNWLTKEITALIPHLSSKDAASLKVYASELAKAKLNIGEVPQTAQDDVGLTLLPLDILKNILLHLGYESLYLRQVCKKFNKDALLSNSLIEHLRIKKNLINDYFEKKDRFDLPKKEKGESCQDKLHVCNKNLLLIRSFIDSKKIIIWSVKTNTLLGEFANYVILGKKNKWIHVINSVNQTTELWDLESLFAGGEKLVNPILKKIQIDQTLSCKSSVIFFSLVNPDYVYLSTNYGLWIIDIKTQMLLQQPLHVESFFLTKNGKEIWYTGSDKTGFELHICENGLKNKKTYPLAAQIKILSEIDERTILIQENSTKKEYTYQSNLKFINLETGLITPALINAQTSRIHFSSNDFSVICGDLGETIFIQHKNSKKPIAYRHKIFLTCIAEFSPGLILGANKNSEYFWDLYQDEGAKYSSLNNSIFDSSKLVQVIEEGKLAALKKRKIETYDFTMVPKTLSRLQVENQLIPSILSNDPYATEIPPNALRLFLKLSNKHQRKVFKCFSQILSTQLAEDTFFNRNGQSCSNAKRALALQNFLDDKILKLNESLINEDALEFGKLSKKLNKLVHDLLIKFIAETKKTTFHFTDNIFELDPPLFPVAKILVDFLIHNGNEPLINLAISNLEILGKKIENPMRAIEIFDTFDPSFQNLIVYSYFNNHEAPIEAFKNAIKNDDSAEVLKKLNTLSDYLKLF
jgi:hypothetical protein